MLADIEIVLKRLRNLQNNINCVLTNKTKTGLMIHTPLQTIFNYKFENSKQQMIHEIIMNHALTVEQCGPNGFNLFIRTLLEKLAVDQYGITTAANTNYSEPIQEYTTMVPTVSDIEWLYTTCFKTIIDKKVQPLFEQALDLVGFNGRIIVEKTHSKHSVELTSGHTFVYEPCSFDLNLKLLKPKIVCIDGFIESVSEIHHLLEAASESKVPIVLFIRGMSKDVEHTLQVNYKRGLIVVPIVIKFDLNSVNTLNDIAVISGCELVSHLKGDLISSIKLENAPFVDEVLIHLNKFVITNAKTINNVLAHIQQLQQKCLETTDQTSDLIQLRIKSLMPKHVIIRLPDDKNFVLSSQIIDYMIRSLKSLLAYGTIDVNNTKLLTSTFVAVKKYSTICVDTIKNIGSMLT